MLAGGTYRNKAGTICNPNGMKYYVEVISMQVDNIVTTNLHHGTCIALQNGKFHEGKKVPKCGLKSTIFHQLLETMQCRKLFKQSFGYKIFSGTGTTGDPSQATNAMQYVSRC